MKEGTQEMPQSRSTILSRHQKKVKKEQIRTSQTLHMTSQTHKQARNITDGPPWNGQ